MEEASRLTMPPIHSSRVPAARHNQMPRADDDIVYSGRNGNKHFSNTSEPKPDNAYKSVLKGLDIIGLPFRAFPAQGREIGDVL